MKKQSIRISLTIGDVQLLSRIVDTNIADATDKTTEEIKRRTRLERISEKFDQAIEVAAQRQANVKQTR
jgi:hypothetical protein